MIGSFLSILAGLIVTVVSILILVNQQFRKNVADDLATVARLGRMLARSAYLGWAERWRNFATATVTEEYAGRHRI